MNHSIFFVPVQAPPLGNESKKCATREHKYQPIKNEYIGARISSGDVSVHHRAVAECRAK